MSDKTSGGCAWPPQPELCSVALATIVSCAAPFAEHCTSWGGEVRC